MKPCPACHAELPDEAVTCPQCGGAWQPDGSFRTRLETDMDRLAAERERKVESAEAFGRLGRPHTAFFLEDRSGGCLVAAVALVAIMLAPVLVPW